jgi:hypothetical protein
VTSPLRREAASAPTWKTTFVEERRAFVVAVIANEGDIDAGSPLQELERPDRSGGSVVERASLERTGGPQDPVLPVTHETVLREERHVEELQHIAERARERDLDHASRVAHGEPRDPVAPSDGVLEVTRDGILESGALLRPRQGIKRIDVVVPGDRLAVTPYEARPQGEGDRLAVRRDDVALGQSRPKRAVVGIRVEQREIDQ